MGAVRDFVSDAVSTVVDKVKSVFCSDSCCVGYNSGPSDNELHAKKIADELARKKTEKHENWNAFENSLLETINQDMNQILEFIEKINADKFGGKPLNIDIQSIKKNIEKLRSEIVGSMGRTFENRLVLTDPELSVIMEERNDAKRARNFDSFYRKIQLEALKNLKTSIEGVISKQNQSIYDSISNRLNEVVTSSQKESESYKDLLKVKEKREAEIPLQIRHMYLHDLSLTLLELTDSECAEE